MKIKRAKTVDGNQCISLEKSWDRVITFSLDDESEFSARTTSLAYSRIYQLSFWIVRIAVVWG